MRPLNIGSRLFVSIVISVVGVALALGHLVWPAVAIDAITTLLLVIAVAPWLGYVFKVVELPGLARFEYTDFERTKAELANAGLVGREANKTDVVSAAAE